MEFWNITSLPQVHYRKPDGTAPVILKVAWCSGGYLGNLVDQSICAPLSPTLTSGAWALYYINEELSILAL